MTGVSWNRGSLAAILLLLLGACVNVNVEQRPNLARSYFILDVNGKRMENQPDSTGVLKLAPVRVAHRYDSKEFVYRIGSESFESDFYNQFLIAPGPMLSDELREALGKSSVFQVVVNSTSMVESTHLLEATVDELYGDFRGDEPGKAVLAMSFVMRRSGATGPVIFRRHYEKTIPLQARSPQALVQGWNRALEETVTALVSDLASAK
jgi:uncharacterized lipoprotein YmbA